MMNPHTQYLAANSRDLEAWIHEHHTKLGHDIEIIKGELGECIGHKDKFTGDTIMIQWR